MVSLIHVPSPYATIRTHLAISKTVEASFFFYRLAGPISQFLNGMHDFSELVMDRSRLSSSAPVEAGKMYARALDLSIQTGQKQFFLASTRTDRWKATLVRTALH